MKRNSAVWVTGLMIGLVTLVTAQSGCGSKETTGGSTSTAGSCTLGSVRCGCYGNGTCDEGLTCLSDLCVAKTSSSTGSGGTGAGSTGQGGGASTGATTTGTTGAGGGEPLHQNLIKNGDFSDKDEYWDLQFQAGDLASSSSAGGQMCITNESGADFLSFSLGYPPTPSDAFALEAGVTYTLSYRVQGTAVLEAKVGGAVEPYTPVASFEDTVSSSASFVTESHLVLSDTGMPQTGLVFNGVLDYYATVCFDDVVLVKN